MTSSMTSRLRIGGTNPGPMPWILCGPGGRPERTGRGRGLDRDDERVGVAVLEDLATPVIVPPVPRPRRATSTRPSSASRISGRSCGGGLGVGRVGELVGQEDVVAVGERARRVDRLVHAARATR
jgi:hypothetical protein